MNRSSPSQFHPNTSWINIARDYCLVVLFPDMMYLTSLFKGIPGSKGCEMRQRPEISQCLTQNKVWHRSLKIQAKGKTLFQQGNAEWEIQRQPPMMGCCNISRTWQTDIDLLGRWLGYPKEGPNLKGISLKKYSVMGLKEWIILYFDKEWLRTGLLTTMMTYRFGRTGTIHASY